MKKLLIPVLCTMMAFFHACAYDVEEELYGTTACQTENVTYSGEILDIIENNCYVCHDAANNFGNVTLEGYDNLKIHVDNGRLLGAIRWESGFSQMPQDRPQLVACNIEKIEEWIAQGALDN